MVRARPVKRDAMSFGDLLVIGFIVDARPDDAAVISVQDIDVTVSVQTEAAIDDVEGVAETEPVALKVPQAFFEVRVMVMALAALNEEIVVAATEVRVEDGIAVMEQQLAHDLMTAEFRDDVRGVELHAGVCDVEWLGHDAEALVDPTAAVDPA